MMKTTLLTFILASCCCAVFAQYYHYECKTSEHASRIWYCVEDEDGLIFLSNSSNGILELDGDHSMYQDGTPFEPESQPIGTMQDRTVIIQLLHSAFTAADLAALRQTKPTFLISYAIVNDSFTPGSIGSVKEVTFRFETDSYFHTIHPDKFQALEEGIKANVKFTLIKAAKPFTSYTMTTVVNSSYF